MQSFCCPPKTITIPAPKCYHIKRVLQTREAHWSLESTGFTRFHFVGIIDWIIVDMIQFPVFLLLSLMLDWNHVVQNPKPLIIWVVFLAWTFWVLSQLSCLSCQGHSCNSSYSHKQPGVVWGAYYKKQRYLSLGKSQEFNISGTKTKVSQILYYTGSSLWTISVINSKSWHH